MSKSLRSKQKRRMRAVKRIRYGEKELKRLQDMVKRTEEKEGVESNLLEKLQAQSTIDKVGMEDSSVTVKTTENAETEMETDQSKANVHKRKTMLNENGQYPSWMNGRRLRKQKAVVKRLKGGKKK